ncbi:MAG: hypothetical protein PF588_11155 [Candidatus Kapabacteria bacterium]|jgi:hypothetical protein|nr:hypothetical protein [Candidatus Kapabacteria bacterium]
MKEDLKKWFESIPPELLIERNKRGAEIAYKEHEKFILDLSAGLCHRCGKPMNSFNKYRFCLHWFTHPDGIKKKYFIKHLQNKELYFFGLENYFRWLAESDKPLVNINDLKDEISETKVLERTIRYKNIEWSFSIAKTDIQGHPSRFNGKEPHYHIQMIINGMSFLKFNDLHIRLSKSDLLNFEMLRQMPENTVRQHASGIGMSIIENPDNSEILLKNMTSSKDEKNSTFRVDSSISPRDGDSLLMNTFNQAIRISNEKNIPFVMALRELQPDLDITSEISPGKGVPKIAQRKKRK